MINIQLTEKTFNSILSFKKDWEIFRDKRNRKKYETNADHEDGFITCLERENALTTLLNVISDGKI